LRVMLLTGDRTAVAQGLARQVGIPESQVIAEVLPAEKAQAIAQLQAQGHVVAMIGDGINDAPALAQAEVGIALKGGTEVASETAGIVLLNDRLSDVLAALDLSRKTLQTIYMNLGWAIVYNLIAIPISAGLLLPTWNVVLTPGQAGILMAVSSITVVGNSILLRWRATVAR
jgi:P-type Cu2+ transporter